MKEQTNSSEVARLRQQIDQEIAAMRLALDGYAETAKHEIITRRLATLGDTLELLALEPAALRSRVERASRNPYTL